MENVARYFYASYLKYITKLRAIPLSVDMLRPAERRVLLSVYDIARNKFVKSAKVVGYCIGSYHPHCLYGTTKLYAKDYGPINIEKIYKKGYKNFVIASYDLSTNQPKYTVLDKVWIGQYTKELYNIELSNNSVVTVTGNHQFLVKGKGWICAEKLQTEDVLVSGNIYMNPEIISENSNIIVKNVKKEILQKEIPMYDFSVPKYQNALVVLFNTDSIFEGKFDFVVAHNSDAGLYSTLVRYVKKGLVDGQGGFYSYGLTDNPPAAMRYTEVKANPKIAKLMELVKYTDWKNIEFEEEPLALPSPVPIGFIGNDISYGIAVHKTTYPSFTIEDLFKRLLFLLDKTKKLTIEPNLEGCTVVNKKDVEQLLTTGKSTIKFRANYSIKNKELHIYGCPVNFNGIVKYAEKNKRSLSDLSSTKVHIVMNDTSKKALEAITSNVQFAIYTVDLNSHVELTGVDKVILNSFESYKKALGRKLESEISTIKQKLDESKIIAKIKPHVKQANSVEELSKTSKVPIEDLKPIVQKYSIQKLINIKTDVDSLNKNLKETTKNLKHIDDYSISETEKLFKEIGG